MKTSRILELEVAIAAFKRPPLRFAPFALAASTLAAAKDWDRQNPESAARRFALIAELEHEQALADRAEAERIAMERALRTSSMKLERSGIGERSLNAAAEAHDTEALGVIKRWRADASLTWLAMCGAKGTGKSVAATWLAREVINAGDTAAFRRTAELAKLSQFDAGAVELEHLKRVHLLVLDDFGAELLTDYAKANLFELLDHRHESYGRTILTSNLPWRTSTRDGQTVTGMSERLGERLVDRLAQAGRVVQLAPEKSLRRGAA